MKTFRIPEPEWAQAMFTRLKTMISNLKSSIDGAGYITHETDPTVPAWAKAASKPTYTAQEVGALPANTPIPTKTSDLTNDSGFITQETDPTVPAWAKAANKPTYTAQEVGALPANTPIPSKTSDLTNDGDGTNNNSPFATQAYVLANGSKGIVDIDYGGQYISEIYPYLNSEVSNHEIRLFTANILRMNLLTNAKINVPAWGLLYRYNDSTGDVYYTMVCFEEYSGNGCFYARVYSNPTDWANEVVHVEAAYEFGKTVL